MKHLLISLVAVTVGMSAAAATVTWKSNAIKGVDTAKDGAFSTTNIGRNNAEGQLYYITGTEYATWLSALAGASTLADQQKKMNELYSGLSNGTIGTGKVGDAVKTAVSSQANIVDPKDYTGATGDNPIDTYAALVYTTTVGEDQYVIANVGNVHLEADFDRSLTALATTFGGDTGSTAIQGWAAVSAPEPTSGLLLLLGMAGLALRRRRA